MTQRKLKIAISISCFRPDTGGQQAHAEQLSQHLQERGHDVVVVTRAVTRVPNGRDYLFFNEPSSSITVKGVPIRPLVFSRFWLPVLWFLGKCVVRPHLEGLAVRLYQLVSRKSARNAFAGADVIHHVGDAPLDLRLLAKADRLLVHTNYEADYFRRKLLFRCPIDVVGNGIEDRV